METQNDLGESFTELTVVTEHNQGLKSERMTDSHSGEKSLCEGLKYSYVLHIKHIKTWNIVHKNIIVLYNAFMRLNGNRIIRTISDLDRPSLNDTTKNGSVVADI